MFREVVDEYLTTTQTLLVRKGHSIRWYGIYRVWIPVYSGYMVDI